ncbi:excisionase [Streptococcus henryi]|uniref:excisionase n=1 Tax=Streptococcus henryi TaxID=439219 RepID=UPI003D15B26E
MKGLSKIKIQEWKTFWPIEVPLDAEYCSYKSIEKYWVDFKKGFAKQIATEMRENRDFSQYILNPTYKTAFFNLLGLRYFMIWKSRNRYKPKKETLAEMLENIKFENQIGA